MAVRKIVHVPEAVLCKKAEKVKIDDATRELAADLLETLDVQVNPKGAGLAAPQIGVSKRVCIAKRFYKDADGDEKENSFILINPEVVWHSDTLALGWEGCLSIPDTYGKVERWKNIKVKTLDLDGNTLELKAEGFFARVIQHEIDHLDGILFTTKVVGETMSEKELDAMLDSQEEK